MLNVLLANLNEEVYNNIQKYNSITGEINEKSI